MQLKFRKFQKPADFDPKMVHVKDILQNVEDGIGVLDIKNSEPEVIQTQLDACMVRDCNQEKQIWKKKKFLLGPQTNKSF